MEAHADPLSAPQEPPAAQGTRPDARARARFGRRFALIVVAGAALIALGVFGLAGGGGPPRRAPELPAQLLVGPRTTLPAMLAGAHGGPVLVVFWASWCGPCQSEARAFARFAASPAGRGRVVGVNWSDNTGGARAFVKQYGWTFPNVRDPLGKVGYAYRISNLPTTFVVGPSQRILAELHGPQSEAALDSALASAS